MDGSSAALLYAYGGFNISLTPGFNPVKLGMLKALGGVWCVANLRGGGEYGEEWHQQGCKDNKQNCFDDFIACGQYLVDQRYTSPSKLCIQGGSNGGLLVGACVNQRPELFGCVVGQVGVMDMLRFHKFTIGSAWCSDFGNPDVPEEFAPIIKYSPLHTVTPALYPSVLLTTADHDDRVAPLHSYKYIAELQHVVGSQEAQKNPLLIRIEVDAGHGGGKPTAKIIEEAADICAFIARSLDVTLVSSDDNSTHQQDDNSTKEQDDKSCLRSCC